jgi:oxygen-independent coproporphyrinogen-3 oxidase
VNSDNVNSDDVESDDVESESLSPYVCRHNLLYWRNQEYVGIGPGAHSHMRTGQTSDDHTPSRRWSNRKPVPGYIRRMEAGEPVADFEETLTPAVARGETMMMGLRLIKEGVARARFRSQHGCDLDQIFATEQASLLQDGLIQVTPSRVRVTPRGLLFANQVAAKFMAA